MLYTGLGEIGRDINGHNGQEQAVERYRKGRFLFLFLFYLLVQKLTRKLNIEQNQTDIFKAKKEWYAGHTGCLAALAALYLPC